MHEAGSLMSLFALSAPANMAGKGPPQSACSESPVDAHPFTLVVNQGHDNYQESRRTPSPPPLYKYPQCGELKFDLQTRKSDVL